MAVGVAAGQHVFAAREGIEIFVEEEALRQIEVPLIAGSRPCKELILRHGVALVPAVAREVLMIARAGLPMRLRFGRKEGRDHFGGAGQTSSAAGSVRSACASMSPHTSLS